MLDVRLSKPKAVEQTEDGKVFRNSHYKIQRDH